jgi:hypothetical protein
MDIQVVGASFLGENNFFYIPKQDFRFTNLLFKPSALPRYGDHPFFAQGIPFKNYTGIKSPSLILDGSATGPSILISTKKESIGFFTRLRVGASSNIPEPLLMFTLYGSSYEQTFKDIDIFPAVKAGYMLWSETGVHYARLLNPGYNNNWYLGGNLKVLSGYQAAHLSNDAIAYSRDTMDGLTVNSMNLNYAYAFGGSFLKPAGYGASMDIGLTFVKRGKTRATETYLKLSEQSSGDYQYKAGISITDLGAIRFFRAATGVRVQADHQVYLENWYKQVYTSLESVRIALAEAVYDPANPDFKSRDRFSVPLAPIVSAQFDYHLFPRIFINSSIDIPVIFSGQFIHQPLRVQICPRWESEKFGLWIPVSYNAVNGFHTGLAVRLAWLIIGTERLGNSLAYKDFTGTDLYISIHIPLTKRK